jgi:Xaa-Pro aminopeptidase
MTRADRLEQRVRAEGLDALLVTGLVNVRYLTGFTGSSGFAVVGPGLRRFITDFRYVTQAEEEVAGFDRQEGPRGLYGALSEGWPAGTRRVGFEPHVMTHQAHGRVRELLPEAIELVPAGTLVEDLRAVKEPEELERIAAASELADAALAAVLERGLAGRTERAVALDLEIELRRRGAEEISFPPIVASAEHGARPHAEPRDVEIARDTLVTIDWGAKLDGYCSDCTRTYATGTLPDELAVIYALVEEAQAAGLAAVRPGPAGREVDAVARDIIEAAGHGKHFGHGLGHGIGLEVHEAPTLSRVGDTALAPGHVVTVEPGVYVPGLGGVRIEDLVAVQDGAPRVFSALPKALQVIA